MSSRDLPIELVFRVLPATAELRTLRDAIIGESVTDRKRQWDGSAAFSTVDQRVVPAEALERIIAAAEADAVAHARALHGALGGVLAHLAEHDMSAVVNRLTELGEAARNLGAWPQSLDWFSVVLGIAAESGDHERVIVAARRIGLAQLHLGNIRASREAYERSMHEAEMVGSREGRIVAHIGLGHLLSVQGQWSAAEVEYKRALDLCSTGDDQLAGQVQLNLAMTSRELGAHQASAEWLERAKEHWHALARSDRSVWFNSQGMLLMETGDSAGARESLESALAHSGSYLDTAMILDNLAHLSIRDEDLTKAESYARRGEEFAIVGNAPRALVEIYTTLATITRLRGQEDGIGFIEKAIQLARDESYHLAHAHALQEYALLRERMQDFDAARDLRLEAATILATLAGDQ